MLGSSSRGRRLPMLLILLAIVVAMAVVAIGVAFSGGGMAVAAPGTDATIEATPFSVASSKIGEEYAVCPGQQRALGGGVVQSGGFAGEVAASGPLAETKDAANTVSGDIAKRWYAAEVNGSANQQSYKVFAICSANSDATIEATPFTVEGSATGKLEDSKTGQEYAVCPPNKRALGGGVVQSGPPDALNVRASGPLAETKDAANTVSGDIAKRWYAWVVNFPYGGPMVNLKVFAICSSAPPGPGPAPGPGPTPPPKVISTVPTANAKGVSPTANITATFSKDMVDSSINPTTFKLFKKGTKAKLQAAVSYSAATDKATLDPTNSLQSGATYRALVTTGAKDLAGNPLDQKHKWFFTVS
jgi:hypothetical protein